MIMHLIKIIVKLGHGSYFYYSVVLVQNSRYYPILCVKNTGLGDNVESKHVVYFIRF